MEKSLVIIILVVIFISARNHLNKGVKRRNGKTYINGKHIEVRGDWLICPNCGASNSLHQEKKGFGAGKSVVGAILLGPIGILAGVLGMNKTRMTCYICGKKV